MQKVLVSGFIYEKGKALLLKRRDEGFLADHWEMPGGKLEFGEDPVCGAIRETKEEAGVETEAVCPYHCWHTVNEYKSQETHFVEIDFILKLKPNQQVKPGDGMTEYKWATEQELDSLLMSPEMKKSVKKGFEWTRNQQQPL